MIDFQIYNSSSHGNFYTLDSGADRLIVEAGVSIKRIKKACNFKLSSVCGAIITHRHKDHSVALPELVRSGIDAYMTFPTAQAYNLEDHHRVHIIEPLKQFKIAGFTILPFETQHDCPGSVGYLVGNSTDKMVFATDTYYVRYKFQGLTHIAVECNYSKVTLSPDLHPVRKRRLFTSHFSLENVVEFLKANDLSKVRAIYLLHISPENADPDIFKHTVQALTGKPVYL